MSLKDFDRACWPALRRVLRPTAPRRQEGFGSAMIVFCVQYGVDNKFRMDSDEKVTNYEVKT